jgi:hypothetical protein
MRTLRMSSGIRAWPPPSDGGKGIEAIHIPAAAIDLLLLQYAEVPINGVIIHVGTGGGTKELRCLHSEPRLNLRVL